MFNCSFFKKKKQKKSSNLLELQEINTLLPSGTQSSGFLFKSKVIKLSSTFKCLAIVYFTYFHNRLFSQEIFSVNFITLYVVFRFILTKRK